MPDLPMDFDTNSEIWDWQCGETFLEDSESFGLQPQTDISESLWTGVTENKEDISYMFDDETTPVKDCGDLTSNVKGKGSKYNNSFSSCTQHSKIILTRFKWFDPDVTSKKLEQCREPCKAVKRRRMLQFDPEILDSAGSNEDIALTFLKSKERNAYFEEAICEVSSWLSQCEGQAVQHYSILIFRLKLWNSLLTEYVFLDGATSSAHEGLDKSSEEWLTDCFNYPELQIGSEDMNTSGVSDVQGETMGRESLFPLNVLFLLFFLSFCVSVAEVQNSPPECEIIMVKSNPIRACGNIVFKGRNSYIQTPEKGASSVVYPFGFMKPCSIQGDMTLKEINKKIHTPPPSKSKQRNQDPPSYPTSAFSGKPVIGKTKIHIEGGRGSITIMRTKG
ncbi:hypothetical protein RND71_043169 [Anisodus tanguticus]|uniref:Protein XRI1 n=1 Tax=Anisodus tanguticus TaxID=243964 RepID=A0AAE1QV09_9SOLA|nr:hypothetical protein RND71_043169 [Anisodus tanguticus]